MRSISLLDGRANVRVIPGSSNVALGSPPTRDEDVAPHLESSGIAKSTFVCQWPGSKPQPSYLPWALDGEAPAMLEISDDACRRNGRGGWQAAVHAHDRRTGGTGRGCRPMA